MKKIFFVVISLLMLIQSIAFADAVFPGQPPLGGFRGRSNPEVVVTGVLTLVFNIAFWANVILLLPLILVSIFVKNKVIKIIAIVLAVLLVLFLISTFVGKAVWMSVGI